jgi:predicted DCC family thiol-disulfide oxidoreductase YuxK
VNVAARVARPPARPLLIYDGDCGFCLRWVARWQRITGERLDYLPFQDAGVAARFQEIPLAQFEKAVHLIEPDGSVYRGAAAALRARGMNPDHRFLLRLYERVPGFAPVAEAAYRLLAGNRRRISRLTHGGRTGD